jgi:putative N-acetyltransferase (TIGR04045 family)
MILETVVPFRSRDVGFKLALDGWEVSAYHRLRRRIFCDEQRLFEGDDRDAIDDVALPIVAVTRVAGIPDDVVGVVRVWEETPSVWWGGRLGTHSDHRRNGTIGPGLVRLAVRSACRRGCSVFRATVQRPNVPLFERLRWTVVGDATVCGLPHALMEADLDHYREGLP